MSEGKNEIKVQLFEVAAFIGQELEDVIEVLQGSFPEKNWTQNSKLKADEEFVLLEKHFKSKGIFSHFEEEMLEKQSNAQKLIDEENAKIAADEAKRRATEERIAKEREIEENAKRAIAEAAEAAEAARIAEQKRLEQIAKQQAEAEKQNNSDKEEEINIKEEIPTVIEEKPLETPEITDTPETPEKTIVFPEKLRTIELPDKKTKKSPKKDIETPKVVEKAKVQSPTAETPNQIEKIEIEKTEDLPIAIEDSQVQAPVAETPQPTKAEVVTEKAKDDNLIRHKPKEIEEANQIRKIDLKQFERPKHTPVKREPNKPSTPAGQRGPDGKRVRSAPKDAKIDPSKYKPSNANKNLRPVTPPDEVAVQKALKENLERMKNQGRKSKTSMHNRDKRREHAERREHTREREVQEGNILKISEFITANELATLMGKPVKDIIKVCMDLGQLVGINQRLDAEIIKFLVDEFGFEVEFVTAEITEDVDDEDKDTPENLKPRAPIVTVMGHVDHGKTSLLDYIRKTNVIAGEAGGITQSIGAYEVILSDGRGVTFLDTPGHEAFTAMRARGAKLTDIAIIVVAANEKVMPQTVEAINHAQAGNLPIVFAITKIDMPGADPTRIKQQLAEMNLLVEEWGGSYQSHDIDAKHGTGVLELLEKVLIQAEMMELTANPDKRAKGTVVEASLDKGRGYVANVLIQEGSINVGDYILAGTAYGRVKAMFNEKNEKIKTAGPSKPIVLLGLNGAPQAGDNFRVTKDERTAKDKATELARIQREMSIRTQKHLTLEEIGRRISLGTFKELNIIVKADVDGSVEAVSDALLKLSTPQVQVNIIHKGVGQIVEGDVSLAIASDAVIIGFQVRPSQQAKKMAEAEQIDIRLYSVIYKATEELKDALEGMLEPETVENIVANIEIREVFHITKVGYIAGCMVLDGKINRSTKVRIIRDGIVVYPTNDRTIGKISSLKRFKDEVKEVLSGQDCGIGIENFNDIRKGDIIEGYEITEKKRSL